MNEPYFVGKDVADILGYQNGSRDINRHVDEEDKLKYRFGTSGQDREMTIIKEPFPHVSKETCLRGYNIMKMTGWNVLSLTNLVENKIQPMGWTEFQNFRRRLRFYKCSWNYGCK